MSILTDQTTNSKCPTSFSSSHRHSFIFGKNSKALPRCSTLAVLYRAAYCTQAMDVDEVVFGLLNPSHSALVA
jgi:hypothetical protein